MDFYSVLEKAAADGGDLTIPEITVLLKFGNVLKTFLPIDVTPL